MLLYRCHKKAYTIEDIYALPEGTRAELIDGEIYYMAPPSTNHQRILHFLDRTIGNYIQHKQGVCEVFPAPFAVYLDENTNTYVEPDISVICDKKKLDDKGCNGAPDWIVDSPKNLISVYDFDNEGMEQYTFSDSVKTGIYNDFAIDFSQLNI